jgi:DNA adenine methylase
MGWIGGKAKIAGKLIIPKIPTDIETFTECFGGMMWTYLKMDLKKYPYLKNVVYNDINGLNTNLFNCSQQYDRMYEEMNKIPRQKKGEFPTPEIYKQMFEQFQKEIFNPALKITKENMFEIACKYVYVVTNGFSGINPYTSTFVDLKGKYICKIEAFLNKLKNPIYQEHLYNITNVENLDYKVLIDKYDSATSFHYVDAPYYGTEGLYANHSFGINQHAELAEQLQTIKGRCAISYYYFEGIENLYSPDFFTYYEMNFKKPSMARADGIQVDATEILITNY